MGVWVYNVDGFESLGRKRPSVGLAQHMQAPKKSLRWPRPTHPPALPPLPEFDRGGCDESPFVERKQGFFFDLM